MHIIDRQPAAAVRLDRWKEHGKVNRIGHRATGSKIYSERRLRFISAIWSDETRMTMIDAVQAGVIATPILAGRG
jgi:hypothetical protein